MVGAVGSGAPWFLTGLAEGTEVEFMIDMGCQVTILATSVFERICASDPQIRSRLRLCGCRFLIYFTYQVYKKFQGTCAYSE